MREEEIDCDFDWVPAICTLPSRRGARSTPRAPGRGDAGLRARVRRDIRGGGAAGEPAGGHGEGPGAVPSAQLSGGPRARDRRARGYIYEHTDAKEFSDDPRTVKANGREITCEHIVLATHNPLVGNRSVAGATLFQTKLALYTSYVVAGRIAKGIVPDALLWDTADPYHYSASSRGAITIW